MGTGHTPSKSFPKYYNGEIKWVSLADSNKLDNVYIDKTKYEISSLGIQNSSAVIHPAGTLLISRDAGVGKSAIMAVDMAVSQHFITYTCSNKLNNLFLYYLFQNRKHEFERIAIGSTIKTIGLPYFKSLMIPLPSISEQEQISKTLLSIDERIWSCKSKLSSISNLKNALMQDLLSGKVRGKTSGAAN
jgi:type I restriction enzyme S subunit